MAKAGSIGAAVVGTGFIGAVHVEALRRIGVEVRGVVGSSPERARQRAEDAGLPPAYASLEEALADDGVQVVHVTSPNHLHHAQVRAVLEAGRHVVCEKPLAMTSEQGADLLALARASGLVHAVNFNIRHYPLCRHLRGLVAEGGLGEVRLVTGSYLQDWLLRPDDWNWRLEPELGGSLRAVADIGSHWLDLLQDVTGLTVESVFAELTTFVPVRRQPTGPVETFAGAGDVPTTPREIRTEDAATILLRFRGGARGSLTVSQVSAGRKNRLSFEVDGARGAMAWSSEASELLWLGSRDEATRLVQRNPRSSPVPELSRLPAGHAEGWADALSTVIRGFYDHVNGGERPPWVATFEDGANGVHLAEAILASSRAERWVTLAAT